MDPLKIYRMYSFLVGFSFCLSATTYAPFVVSLGLSYADLALINALFWIMIVVAELPTGMWADGKSRAWSVRMGLLVISLAMLVYSGAEGFWSALAAEVLAGIGHAFISGADTAWITDALDKRGEGSRLSRAQGEATIARAFGACLGGLCGAWLGTHDLRLPWIAEGLMAFLAYGYCYRTMGDLGEPLGHHKVTELVAMRQSWQAIKKSRALVWVLGLSSIAGLWMPFNHYWSPYFRGLVGDGQIGFLWIAMQAALAISGFVVRRGVGISDHGGMVAMLVLAGGSLALMGWGNSIPFATTMLLLHEVGRGAIPQFQSLYTHKKIESGYRATYGSLHSFLCRPAYGLILCMVWLMNRGQESTPGTIAVTWFVSGSLLVGLSLLAWRYQPPA